MLQNANLASDVKVIAASLDAFDKKHKHKHKKHSTANTSKSTKKISPGLLSSVSVVMEAGKAHKHKKKHKSKTDHLRT